MNTQTNGRQKRKSAVMKMDCEVIQDLLMDYETRELGEGRSDLVREHVRRCDACRARYAEMLDTLQLLHSDDLEGDGTLRLSNRSRDRIRFAFTHPVLDWIYRHHVLVSWLTALLALGLLFVVLRRVNAWHTERIEAGPVVVIGEGPPPENAPPPVQEKKEDDT